MTTGLQSSRKIRIAIWVVCVVFVMLMVIAPVYLLVKYSISDSASINTGGKPIPIWPYSPTVATFRYLFSDSQFFEVIQNSLIIAVGTVMMSMLLGVPAAYVFGRYKVPGRKFLLLGLISVRLFPDIATIIPIASFFIKFEGHNTFWGIILAHSLLALPYVIFIVMSAFENIPNDLDEQALVMGASRFQRFHKVLLPLTVPGLTAAAIYTFLLSWDEFIFSYFLLGMGKISTLTLYLNARFKFAPPQNLLAAISVCLSLPVIVFSMAVQKYNTAGIVSGGVK